MVKNKRDLKSPRRNRSFTGSRPVTRGRANLTNGNIRVVVRVRPINERELGGNFRNVIEVMDEATLVFDPKEEDDPFFYHGVQQRNRDVMRKANKNLLFTFDKVFSDEATNENVFENTTKSLIQTLMNGYNCSVFVYGATGAGKTHTMLGRGDDPGITFLTMNELFQQKNQLSNERDFEVGMSYLEVYNENVQDLLNPGPALRLREDGKYGVVVAGIQVRRIESSETLFELLEQGNRRRTQHPTDSNAESSRSHAIFQVYLKMKLRMSGEIRVAKLSMIDLAGSERGAATGYTGARFTEGANINKSLLALGNCINSLADGQKHVPYRDSKLTRLLKDSLGGNCQTVMVANLSPSLMSYEDTYNTLKYAMRAKNIKSTTKKNVVNCESNINYYMKLVDDLTKENQELKLKLSLNSQGECKCKEIAVNDAALEVQLKAFFSDRREMEQRILQLESTESLLTIRMQLKEESDARLSGICSDTPDKEYGHRRLGNAVDRLARQAAGLKKELAQLRERSEQLDVRVKEFVENAPQLQKLADMEETELMSIKAHNKAEHLQKVSELQSGELRMRDQLIERFSNVLKPCFLQLRGHGHATDNLIASYQELIKHLQGIRSVTWDDEVKLDHTFVIPDDKPQIEQNENILTKETDDVAIEKQENVLGEISAQSLMYRVPQLKSPNVHSQEEVSCTQPMYRACPLNETITVAPLGTTHVPSQMKFGTKRPAVKASHLAPAKKTLRSQTVSPRIPKENRVPFQARPVPLSNAPRGLGETKIGKSCRPRTASTQRSVASIIKK